MSIFNIKQNMAESLMEGVKDWVSDFFEKLKKESPDLDKKGGADIPQIQAGVTAVLADAPKVIETVNAVSLFESLQQIGDGFKKLATAVDMNALAELVEKHKETIGTLVQLSPLVFSFYAKRFGGPNGDAKPKTK